ncbi:short-chain dehydrogenase/reductase SDR [Chloroherpeton thalassium ATCC 35110]|uniref:Short-chain dehydrogenase/reductase SDR n=1 Tax=Chloroherpeton thalassium (strain ATCC 35110 / GB-78) TaxID=517418 RepID=B3QYK7_CHLT3|nr:SDR family oxidoreductase [Chloroherpeton thalassium]ACF13635.1 short-chain dehydrogenase/reductase SDR [Chloroherpeton thalassium ATCC 35110]
MAYILITGASSGIGEVFAKEYARRGNDLVLVARSESKLQEIAAALSSERKVTVKVFSQDLSEQGSAERVFDYCRANNLQVELLINNAGFGLTGEFVDQPVDRLEQMILLNINTMMKLTHLFLPQMLARKTGGVINVASTAAFQPVPYMSVYAATKAFVLNFSEGLHEELQGSGVKVMALCPGGTETQFFEVANYSRSKLMIPLEKPEEVVKVAIEGFRSGNSFIISGFANKVLNFFERFLPRELVAKIAGSLFRQ